MKKQDANKQEALTEEQLEKVAGGLRAAQADPSQLGDGGDFGAGNLSGDVVPSPDQGGHTDHVPDGPLGT